MAEWPTSVPTLTPSRWPIAPMYSGNVSHVQGTPASSTSIGMASTYDSMPASFRRSGALTGASASEQLPMITVVAP